SMHGSIEGSGVHPSASGFSSHGSSGGSGPGSNPGSGSGSGSGSGCGSGSGSASSPPPPLPLSPLLSSPPSSEVAEAKSKLRIGANKPLNIETIMTKNAGFFWKTNINSEYLK
ncbi:MAG TPA: hypothetical protein VFY55_07360, partial [Nitrososphaeraceae archaeon]|nr:hypothetical protein [Nitrososphaeraceae archaeon]